MVLGSVGDVQWGSIVHPLYSRVRDSVRVGEAVKKGKAIFIDTEVRWLSLDHWQY